MKMAKSKILGEIIFGRNPLRMFQKVSKNENLEVNFFCYTFVRHFVIFGKNVDNG